MSRCRVGTTWGETTSIFSKRVEILELISLLGLDQKKSTHKSVQVFLRCLKKQMGKNFCPTCITIFFSQNSYFTLQNLRSNDIAGLLSALWTIISVLCTALLFSKQSSGVCCLSPEKWNSKPLAGFALYNLILYDSNVLMQPLEVFQVRVDVNHLPF